MQFIVVIGLLIVGVFIMRGIGSWMLRIDEVISNQKEMIKQNDKIISLLERENQINWHDEISQKENPH